jgi:membrane associated rhomboid family serine protease
MDQPEQPAAGEGLPSCYRHEGRGTGVRCTRCERPVCPECMVSASVGFQCPECVSRGSGTGHAPNVTRPRTVAGGPVTTGRDPRLITKILIGINIAVFIVANLPGSQVADDLSLLGNAIDAQGHLVGVADGQWYRLVTSIFDHQQIWHIGFNMLSLWWIGAPLEAALGRLRYITLYLIAGLAGSALTYLIAAPNGESLGASGAIFGLFGATAVLVRKLRYDMRPVIALLVINLIITFAWAGIAWQAHIGGLVAGTLVAIGMVHAPRAHRTAVQIGTCALVLAATIVVIAVRTAMLT